MLSQSHNMFKNFKEIMKLTNVFIESAQELRVEDYWSRRMHFKFFVLVTFNSGNSFTVKCRTANKRHIIDYFFLLMRKLHCIKWVWPTRI